MNLFINADDFGKTQSINNAIVNAFQYNYINSTTLMANMDFHEEAIELAHKHKFQNNVGIHLVLTEGDPLTDIKSVIPGLFSGNLSLKERLKLLMYPSARERKAIHNELSAQIRKIKAQHIPISHLDTHHQVHDMWGIISIIKQLLKEHNIPSMRILNNLEISSSRIKNGYRNFCNRNIINAGINFSSYMGSQTDFFNYRKQELIHDSTLEIMVHPDYNAAGQLVDFIGKEEISFNQLGHLLTNN